METTSQEVIFHQDKNVIVTQSRFVSFGKTYAMRNIASVSIFEIPRSRGLEMLLFVVGMLLLIGDSTRVVGCVMIVISVVLFFILKSKFSVRINSNSGEADGLISGDRSYVEKVVDALNDAIIHRG